MTRAVVQAPHEGRRDRCVSRATGRGRHRAGTLAHSANRVQKAPPAQGCRANGNDLTAPPRAGSELANPGAAPPRMRIRPGACTGGLCRSDSEGSLGSGGRAQGCPAAPLGWSQYSAGLRGQRAVLPPPRSPRKPPETERCFDLPVKHGVSVRSRGQCCAAQAPAPRSPALLVRKNSAVSSPHRGVFLLRLRTIPGLAVCWAPFPWFCFVKLVPGDKNPCSFQITSSSPGLLGFLRNLWFCFSECAGRCLSPPRLALAGPVSIGSSVMKRPHVRVEALDDR